MFDDGSSEPVVNGAQEARKSEGKAFDPIQTFSLRSVSSSTVTCVHARHRTRQRGQHVVRQRHRGMAAGALGRCDDIVRHLLGGLDIHRLHTSRRLG